MVDLLGHRSFVGRGLELARLREALAATVATGVAFTVVIGGEAGIGKSRLVERFLEEVKDARVVQGVCLEVAENALPYGPFVGILRTLVRETPPERLPAVLGPGRAELTQLLPELATRAADLPGPREPDRASQARLFELVLGVLERLARERPLVIAIEDVQWADRSTRDLIGFLSGTLRDDPVLLLLTTRTDQSGEAVGNIAFLAELEREEHVDRIELRRFDRDEVAEQAAGLLDEPPSPSVIDRLLTRTDGNPFYVEELIVAGAGVATALPPVLRDVLTARVRGLTPAARDILRAAAAAGRQIDDELLGAALDLSTRALASGLREALESGILVRVETPAGPVSEFRHALLQEVVDGELFPGERAALHFAFAEALEARLSAGDASVNVIEVARHWDAARQPARALPFMVRAADGAEAVYAFTEAQHLWERGAAILEDLPAGTEVAGRDLTDLFVHASDCAALAGEPRRAAELVQRALLQLYPGGDPELVLNLENRQRWHLWWAGERASTMAAVQSALDALPAAQPSVARARVLAQLAGIRMLSGDIAGSAVCAREAIEMGEVRGAHAEIALAYGVLGWDTAVLGDIEAGIASFRRGQALAEAVGSVEGMAVAATNLAALLDRVGRSEAALDAALAGYALTERLGVARSYGAILLGHAAKAQFALGRWDDADRSTSLGLRRGVVDAGAVWLGVNRARLLVGRGRFAEAGVLLKRARLIDERLGGSDYRTALVAAEAELAAWAGSLEDALACADRGLAILASAGAPDPSLAWLAALVLRAIADARSAAAGRRPTEATIALDAWTGRVAAHIDAALSAVAENPAFTSGDRAQALLVLLRAESDRVAGRAVPDAWHDVSERWARLHRPFQVAYARLREAEAIVASRGDRDRAASAIAEAAGIAAQLGAGPLAERVKLFARQARLSLPSAPETEPGPGLTEPGLGLTAREAEVLGLVAAGWTNRQIADALFITRKTASVHVSNVMGKLGAANRGEAAALAHRLGLVGEIPVPAGDDRSTRS